jgi:hypothetical protein
MIVRAANMTATVLTMSIAEAALPESALPLRHCRSRILKQELCLHS